MLRRIGSKKKLMPIISQYFPADITTFIDLFFGTGAASFYMLKQKRCQHVFANDKENDIFNLFMMIKTRQEELLEAVTMMPVHESLFQHWKTNEEKDPLWQAVRFLLVSNFGYLGKPDMLHFRKTNSKKILLQHIQHIFCTLLDTQFLCEDFREVLAKISWKEERDYQRAFIYADPPYLNRTTNYQDSFTEADSQDLFNVLVNSGLRFALSEFAHPFILEQAEARGLYMTDIGERQTLKNRRTEILITNYPPEPPQGLLF